MNQEGTEAAYTGLEMGGAQTDVIGTVHAHKGQQTLGNTRRSCEVVMAIACPAWGWRCCSLVGLWQSHGRRRSPCIPYSPQAFCACYNTAWIKSGSYQDMMRLGKVIVGL